MNKIIKDYLIQKIKECEKKCKNHNKKCYRLICIVCIRNSTELFTLKDVLKDLDIEEKI